MKGWARKQMEQSLGGYVILGSHVLLDRRLSAGAVRMYGLVRLVGRNRVELTTTQQELADLAGVSVKTVDRHLGELVSARLIKSRPVPRVGTAWTFLPPDTSRMTETFAVLLDRSVQSPSAVLPTGDGPSRHDPLGSTADQGRQHANKGERQEVDENTRRPGAARGGPPVVVQVLGLEVTAAAMASVMRQQAITELGFEGSGRVLLPRDLLPWLQDGVEPDRVRAGWTEYIAHLKALVGTSGARDFDRWRALREKFMSKGASRRVMDDFADWLLSGAELADPEDRMRLPVDQVMDIKRAADALRARVPLNRPIPTSVSLSFEIVDRLSVTAVGVEAVLARMADGWGDVDLGWDDDAPWVPIVGAILDRADRDRLDSTESLIRGVDELLDVGRWRSASDGVERADGFDEVSNSASACDSDVVYHRRKHEFLLTQEDGLCACGSGLELGCDQGLSFWDRRHVRRAVLHRSHLYCARCLARAVDREWHVDVDPGDDEW